MNRSEDVDSSQVSEPININFNLIFCIFHNKFTWYSISINQDHSSTLTRLFILCLENNAQDNNCLTHFKKTTPSSLLCDWLLTKGTFKYRITSFDDRHWSWKKQGSWWIAQDAFLFWVYFGVMTLFAIYSIIHLHSLKIVLLSVRAFVNLCPFILGLYRDKFVRICQLSSFYPEKSFNTSPLLKRYRLPERRNTERNMMDLNMVEISHGPWWNRPGPRQLWV